MKKVFGKCLVIGVFMILMIGMTSSGYGMGWLGGGGGGGHHKVPEPTTLALVGAGIVGVGAYLYIKRKKRK